MTRQATFNTAFARYGGQLHDSIVDSGLRYPRDQFQHFTGSVFNCDYVANDGFNALATISSGEPLIGIYAGVWPYLVCYFSTLLSDPHVFPWIGNPAQENFDAVRVETFREPLSSPEAFARAASPPKCEVRREAVGLLAFSAFLFIAYHEAAHITRGHLDFLRDEFGVGVFEELSMSVIEDREAKVRKAFEFDADSASAVISLATWRDLWASELENPAIVKQLDVDDVWLTSIGALFVLFEVLQSHAGRAPAKTHPSPELRYISVGVLITANKLETPFLDPIIDPIVKHRSGDIHHLCRWFSQNFNDKPFFVRSPDPGREIIAIRNELAPFVESLTHHVHRWESFLANAG
jgi:hypothetical protein